jgi:SNF2 family DNA or RNA helicase
MQWAKAELTERVGPAMQLREAMDAADNGSMAGLYPFQRAGAQFLITAKNALLGDPMGAGKTVQTIAAAKSLNAIPALVICPSTMRRTWGREIEKWWPGTPVYIVEGTAAKRAKTLARASETPGFVVINWEAVRLHSRLAGYGSIALTQKERTPGALNEIPFKLVVADEAHRMKDPKSKQTRATWAVAHGPTVANRWALTGTPLTNAPDTLWPVLHYMDPTEWPSKTAFIERYCLKSFNIWGGLDIFGIRPDREDEFFEIFQPRFRRMPKEVILPQLPPLVYSIREVEMNAKQQKCYDSMCESMFTETDDGDWVIASNPVSQLTRLTQYASAYIEEDSEGKLILSDPSSKLDALMDDLDDLPKGLIIFAVSRQLLNMLAKRFENRPKTKGGPISYSIIQGGQSVDTRQNAIDAFQSEKVDHILVVIAAGGVGITLTRSDTEIFLQRPWSNVDRQQAIGRGHRIGSEIHETVNVIDYITKGTVEERQMDVLDEKAERLEEIVKDKDAIKRFLKGKKEEE